MLNYFQTLTCLVLLIAHVASFTTAPFDASYHARAEAALSEHYVSASHIEVAEVSSSSGKTRVVIDVAEISSDSYNLTEMFPDITFPANRYKRFEGLDDTSLYASSVSISDKWVVVGADGFNIFRGVVHVYKPITRCSWTLQALIESPGGSNANFGLSVDLASELIIVGANAYSKCLRSVVITDSLQTNTKAELTSIGTCSTLTGGWRLPCAPHWARILGLAMRSPSRTNTRLWAPASTTVREFLAQLVSDPSQHSSTTTTATTTGTRPQRWIRRRTARGSETVWPSTRTRRLWAPTCTAAARALCTCTRRTGTATGRCRM